MDHSKPSRPHPQPQANNDCFKLPVEMQYTCLTQTGIRPCSTMATARPSLTASPAEPNSDFINQASYTGLAGAGNYSAYVGAIVDLVRITSGLHTRHYQYIPAIASPAAKVSNLRLQHSGPPSITRKVRHRSSVCLRSSRSPPRSAHPNPKKIDCLPQTRGGSSPSEGAPLVYSTAFAHDLVPAPQHPRPQVCHTPPSLPERHTRVA